MSSAPSPIMHVSDTALLVAACRALESERSDAFVRDPFAARLAGERGQAMVATLAHSEIMIFGIAIRTRFLDELLLQALTFPGVETVVNLGSGLDTRPWRLELPPQLRWVEVDLPAMLDSKEALMAGETPRCRRERLSADLNDRAQRQALYTAVGPAPALMLTEGLLMYLPGPTVESLAVEASQESGICQWLCDITTTAFFQAIGGGGTRAVRHVQADNHLPGEEILATLYRHGWTTAAHRSSIRDLSFAQERIGRMMAHLPKPATPPPFVHDDPTGVHRFARA